MMHVLSLISQDRALLLDLCGQNYLLGIDSYFVDFVDIISSPKQTPPFQRALG